MIERPPEGRLAVEKKSYVFCHGDVTHGVETERDLQRLESIRSGSLIK
jgi:hypothetical protein